MEYLTFNPNTADGCEAAGLDSESCVFPVVY